MNNKENINWLNNQFLTIKLPDKRLIKRLKILTTKMMEKPSFSIPEQQNKWKNIKGAYRFFSSNRITYKDLIKPHIKMTKEIVSEKNIILAIQDTCYISYAHHQSVEGLSDVGGPHRKRDKGLILHTTLAVDPTKQQPEVIGLLDQYIHTRNKLVDKNEHYIQYQKRWKESKLWEEASQRVRMSDTKTKIVEVMDREGDLFDIMKNCLNLGHDFLIRSSHNRRLNNSEQKKLFEHIIGLKTIGKIEIDVQKKQGQIPRKAKLDISISKIEMQGPKSRFKEKLACNVVHVIEKNSPFVQKPLEWILLTSVEVNSFDDACKIIKWYKFRWLIEEYHKCIKTGCCVEKKQLKNRKTLENFLGIANVIAVRLLQLKDLMRNAPDEPAEEKIDQLKLKILLQYTDNANKKIDIKTYYKLVAQMGGFIGRKSDGNPGWQTLWKGEFKLSMMTEGAKLLLESQRCG